MTPGHPEVGSMWERDDCVYEVLGVYEAKQRTADGGFKPVTLVKIVEVDPLPWHCNLDVFRAHYEPYDPDAE